MDRRIASKRLIGALIAGLVIGHASQASADPRNQSLPYGEVRWGSHVRVSAIGLPPFGATGALSAREVARQNALNLAQRRLLSVVLQLPSSQGTVQDRLKSPESRDKLRKLIGGARVAGKELADGSAEVTLDLPFEGPGGLRDFIDYLNK